MLTYSECIVYIFPFFVSFLATVFWRWNKVIYESQLKRFAIGEWPWSHSRSSKLTPLIGHTSHLISGLSVTLSYPSVSIRHCSYYKPRSTLRMHCRRPYERNDAECGIGFTVSYRNWYALYQPLTHWQRIPERIRFRLWCVLAFCCLHVPPMSTVALICAWPIQRHW